MLVASLAVGVGLTFLLSKNHPVFFTLPSLSNAVRVPVYGLIGALPAPGQKRRTLLFMIFSLALLVPYLLVSTRTNEIVAVLKMVRNGIPI